MMGVVARRALAWVGCCVLAVSTVTAGGCAVYAPRRVFETIALDAGRLGGACPGCNAEKAELCVCYADPVQFGMHKTRWRALELSGACPDGPPVVVEGMAPELLYSPIVPPAEPPVPLTDSAAAAGARRQELFERADNERPQSSLPAGTVPSADQPSLAETKTPPDSQDGEPAEPLPHKPADSQLPAAHEGRFSDGWRSAASQPLQKAVHLDFERSDESDDSADEPAVEITFGSVEAS